MDTGEAERMHAMQKQEEDLVAAATEAQAAAASQTSWLTELDAAFSRTGIQSFAVEGVLGELQVCSSIVIEYACAVWHCTRTTMLSTTVALLLHEGHNLPVQ